MVISQEIAETVGLRAVAFVAGHKELLPVFLGATGASEQDFRRDLQEPGFQAAVLDFLLMDDQWIAAFCDTAELAYDLPMQARATLAGGEVHWT